MYESNQIDTVLLEEPPSEQGSTLPSQTPSQPPAPKKGLTAVAEHLRALLAGLSSSIKSHPRLALAWAIGIGLMLAAVGLGVWRLYHSRATVPTHPQAARTIKPQRASNSRAAQIEELENLARGAYKRFHYVLPVDASVLAYSKRALDLDPLNNYSRMMLGNSIERGKYQVREAIKRKDFVQAHRVANAMARLLPGRKDIAQLQQRISAAEAGAAAARRPKAVSTVSFSAYHLHSEKAPADHGPYCSGILTVSGHHLKFSGRSASQGQKVHKLDFACSEIREIKKNPRIGSRQGGFHIRTASATANFVPRDSSLTHISALASACSK